MPINFELHFSAVCHTVKQLVVADKVCSLVAMSEQPPRLAMNLCKAAIKQSKVRSDTSSSRTAHKETNIGFGRLNITEFTQRNKKWASTDFGLALKHLWQCDKQR